MAIYELLSGVDVSFSMSADLNVFTWGSFRIAMKMLWALTGSIALCFGASLSKLEGRINIFVEVDTNTDTGVRET